MITFRLLGLKETQQHWVVITAFLAESASPEGPPSRNLLDHHPYGLLVLHAFRVTFATVNSGKILGYTDPQALTGLPFPSLVFPPDRPQMGELLHRTLREEAPEARVRLKDGQGAPAGMEVCLTLLEGNEHPTLQMVFRSVSQDQNLERALRSQDERQWCLLNRALRKSEERTQQAIQKPWPKPI